MIKFYHKFKKKSRQILKKMILWKILEGGDNINWLVIIFFTSLIINLFVSIYTIYIFFEIKILNHGQGAKLNLKKQSLIKGKEE